jgi:hypothetical protein
VDISATPTLEKSMKDALLASARALDHGRWQEARERLRSAPLVRSHPSQRLVAAALWKRILRSSRPSDRQPIDQDDETLTAFDKATGPLRGEGDIWATFHALPSLELKIGAADAAAIVATTLWDIVLKSDPTLFSSMFELFFRAGASRCLDAWEQFLVEQTDYLPSFWDFVLLTKSLPGGNRSDFATTAGQSLRAAQREDLAPLFAVYLKQTRQAPVGEIVAAARALSTPAHRMRVADYMAEMGYMPDEVPVVVAAFAELAGESDADGTRMELMRARLANAERRWHDVITFADLARASPRHRCAADLLRAHALCRTGESRDAIAILEDVGADKKVAPFQRSRAAFIRVTAECVKRGLAAPDEVKPRSLPVAAGRPLAQSLWVGPRLRWIERLAIQSYLDNGWRFQLYAYDDPDNVPDGCEVLDATTIIPAKEIFREGMNSGAHAGSIGAFSDLFRYQLLYMRGGMWTDTDVINLKRFEPDGQRFICTEIVDAGLTSLNGAIMAAPAGDPFLARACERSRELLASTEGMFFTRIGPYLLAELFIEMGVGAIELMPPGFLSPVSWMSAGSLLQPFTTVTARREFREAVNLHVYTEIWRTLGLGLDHPPGPDTFIGRLYADLVGKTEAEPQAVNA